MCIDNCALGSAGSLFIGADRFIRPVKVCPSWGLMSAGNFSADFEEVKSTTRPILWRMFSQISSLNFHTNVDPDRLGIIWWIFSEFHCTHSDSVRQPTRDSAPNRVFHNKRCTVVWQLSGFWYECLLTSDLTFIWLCQDSLANTFTCTLQEVP